MLHFSYRNQRNIVVARCRFASLPHIDAFISITSSTIIYQLCTSTFEADCRQFLFFASRPVLCISELANRGTYGTIFLSPSACWILIRSTGSSSRAKPFGSANFDYLQEAIPRRLSACRRLPVPAYFRLGKRLSQSEVHCRGTNSNSRCICWLQEGLLWRLCRESECHVEN